MRLIDSRANTVMTAVIPGFKPNANVATPPSASASTTPPTNNQGASLTSQPPAPDGPSTAYVARGSVAQRTIENNMELEQFTWEPGSNKCIGCNGNHRATDRRMNHTCPNKGKRGYMEKFDRNVPILKEWCKEDKRRNGGRPNKKFKGKKGWNKLPDNEKKDFVRGIVSNKEKAAHFRTLTQEVVKEENLDDHKPAAVPSAYG